MLYNISMHLSSCCKERENIALLDRGSHAGCRADLHKLFSL